MFCPFRESISCHCDCALFYVNEEEVTGGVCAIKQIALVFSRDSKASNEYTEKTLTPFMNSMKAATDKKAASPNIDISIEPPIHTSIGFRPRIESADDTEGEAK